MPRFLFTSLRYRYTTATSNSYFHVNQQHGESIHVFTRSDFTLSD